MSAHWYYNSDSITVFRVTVYTVTHKSWGTWVFHIKTPTYKQEMVPSRLWQIIAMRGCTWYVTPTPSPWGNLSILYPQLALLCVLTGTALLNTLDIWSPTPLIYILYGYLRVASFPDQCRPHGTFKGWKRPGWTSQTNIHTLESKLCHSSISSIIPLIKSIK